MMASEQTNNEDIYLPTLDVSSVQRKWLDLPYADVSSSQKLDIYLPEEGSGPFPVIFHSHGGAFAYCDKRDIQLRPFFQGLRRGYAVVSANYRLSGEAIFPTGLLDLKAAIRWLRVHAADYRLDGGRIAACGSSAGGYYSAMLALTPDVPQLDAPSLDDHAPSCRVQAAVDWYGPTDFLQMDPQLAESGLGHCSHHKADSPESRLLGGQLEKIPERVAFANPIRYVSADMPPMLIQHGRLDHTVPVQQSILLADAIRSKVGAGRVEMDVLEQAGHSDPLFETEENLERVFAFLDRCFC